LSRSSLLDGARLPVLYIRIGQSPSPALYVRAPGKRGRLARRVRLTKFYNGPGRFAGWLPPIYKQSRATKYHAIADVTILLYICMRKKI
jgi:hypothetical protein